VEFSAILFFFKLIAFSMKKEKVPCFYFDLIDKGINTLLYFKVWHGK